MPDQFFLADKVLKEAALHILFFLMKKNFDQFYVSLFEKINFFACITESCIFVSKKE